MIEKSRPIKAGEPGHFWPGSISGGLNWRIARRAAGAAACSAQRSDGGGGTFNFIVLAVFVLSSSRATERRQERRSRKQVWDYQSSTRCAASSVPAKTERAKRM